MIPHLRHRSASLEVFRPFSTQQPRRELHCSTVANLRTLVLSRFPGKRCCSRRRTRWGGSFVTFQATILTRLPSSSRSSCAGAIGESDPLRVTLAEDPPCRATPLETLVLSGRVMHRRDSFSTRCSATRSRTSTAWPDDNVPPSFHFSPGGAPGFNCPSQVCSRKWVARHFCPSGPTCHFDAPRPDPIGFRRA